MNEPYKIGIIAEWNPFHRGHEQMIASIKSEYPRALLYAAMSGSFVQRGEPALFDKWNRASWAVRSGIDAVFELPSSESLQSADFFAESGITLLFLLGCHAAAFGTESLDAESLSLAAKFSLTKKYQTLFREALHDGLSYASAAHEAMSSFSGKLADELTKPNNLLGYKYAEAILRHGYAMKLITVRRDMIHNISASSARKELISCGQSTLLSETIRPEAEALIAEGNYTDYERYEDACLLFSRITPLSRLKDSGLFSEGLEQKWKKESSRTTYTDMLDHVKSKRYLYSRLKRIGANLLLTGGNPVPFRMLNEDSAYARLLALNHLHSESLRTIRIPVITSTARGLRILSNEAARSLSWDIQATNSRALFQRNRSFRAANMDFYRSPVIL